MCESSIKKKSSFMDYPSKLETMSLQHSTYLSNIYEIVVSFECEKRFRKLKNIKLKNIIEQRNTITAIGDKAFHALKVNIAMFSYNE